jgi:hypothetical protein
MVLPSTWFPVQPTQIPIGWRMVGLLRMVLPVIRLYEDEA